MLGLLIVAIGFAFLMTEFTSVPTTVSFTRFDNPGWEVGRIGWTIWAVVLITGTTNAVNLTDGLDGLAAGASAMAFAAFTFVGFWQFRHLDVYEQPGTRSIWRSSAAAMVGAASSAFSGGTRRPRRSSWVTRGRSPSAAGLAAMSLATGTQLLLPIVGGLFVDRDDLGDPAGASWFRTMGGRRLFKHGARSTITSS